MKKLLTIPKEWIIEQVREHLKRIIIWLVGAIGLTAIGITIKTWLTTEHSLSLTGWFWILIFAATAAIPLGVCWLVQSTKRKRPSHLTDLDDIKIAITDWMVCNIKKRGFRRTVRFETIDEECNMPTGTAKKFLPNILADVTEQGGAIDFEYGKETITIERKTGRVV